MFCIMLATAMCNDNKAKVTAYCLICIFISNWINYSCSLLPHDVVYNFDLPKSGYNATFEKFWGKHAPANCMSLFCFFCKVWYMWIFTCTFVAHMCLPMYETIALEEIHLTRNIVNFINKWKRAYFMLLWTQQWLF